MNVIKKDGSKEAFDKSKIAAGCRRAGASDAVAARVADAVAKIVSTESKSSSASLKKAKDGMKTSQIGELVIAELKKLDKKASAEFETFFNEAMH